MLKKSQAALEFLTTYAWAFLVILIMVGALAYFGILRPSKVFPDRCNFGSEFGCMDFKIGTDTLNLRIKNNVGEPIVIAAETSITLSADSTTAYTCTTMAITGKTFPSVTWNSAEILEFAGTGCNGAAAGFVVGEKAKVFITITYYAAKSSATYSHQVSGEIYSAVIA